MEAPIFCRAGVLQQIRRLALFVAHGQQAVCGFHQCADHLRQLVQTAAAGQLKLRSPKCCPKRLVIRHDLLRRAPQRVLCPLNARLRCRAQNDRRAALLAQKLDGKIKKRQQFGRHGLDLIDHDDAVTKSLKPANGSRFPVEQRVQQLNQRRQNDRRVPALHQKFALVKRVLRCIRLHNVGMVLQDQPIVPYKLPNLFRVLFQNRQQRRGENQAFFPKLFRVRQCIPQ